MLDALELPGEWLPPVLESPDARARRRPACRSPRAPATRQPRRSASASTRPGPALGRPRHVRRRLRGAPGVPRPTRRRACTLLPRRARHLARDGRDALGRRLARSGSATRSRRTSPYDELLARGRALGARAPRALLFLPYLQGERTPHADPDARGAFVGLSCATTAARSSAPCSRASPSACATRSSSCARSASRSRVGRVSGGGARSELWLEIVASVLGLPLERTVVEEGAAYGAALLGGVAGGRLRRRRTRRWRRRCEHTRSSNPTGTGRTSTQS